MNPLSTLPRPQAELSPTSTVGTPCCRVLLVEDNPDSRTTLGMVMEAWGHQVEVAEDGPEGLRKALAYRPQVAILDIGLPGLDGYQLAARIREALGSSVYLVALTGYCQPNDRRLALEAGFDLFMVKPPDFDRLSGLLDSIASDAYAY